MIDYTLIFDAFPLLLRGAAVSLQIACVSCCLGLLFGSLLALVESAGPLLLRLAAGPGGVARRALVGLRWFDSRSEEWRGFGGMSWMNLWYCMGYLF